MNKFFFSTALALLLSGASAFNLPQTRAPKSFVSNTKLYSEEPTKTPRLASIKKDIVYDEKSGRFFESTPGDCMPDDEFCIVDSQTGDLVRLTVAEKERIFLDALQSYYVSGRQMLTDSEFDILKEDLAWNGSPVANLNREELKYLQAVQAYSKGTPIISDDEYNALKNKLREDGSQFAVSTEPKCYVDTGICTVTMQEDNFRSNLLYLPAGLALFVAWLGLGYETIGLLIKINPLVLTLIGSPFIYTLSKTITEEFLFKDKKVVYGPCPSCEAENRIYFGDILGVEGFGSVAEVKCPNCKTTFNVQRATLRASTVPKN